MANYIATDTDLGAVADAIRTKGGTAAQLEFPNGFVSAVGEIPTSEPTEIATDAEMTALLVSANVGKAYLFTGTTGTYTNGDIYVVEEGA